MQREKPPEGGKSRKAHVHKAWTAVSSGFFNFLYVNTPDTAERTWRHLSAGSFIAGMVKRRDRNGHCKPVLTLRQWDGSPSGRRRFTRPPFTTAHGSRRRDSQPGITKREVTKKEQLYRRHKPLFFTDFARKASPFRAESSQNQISTRRNKELYRRAAFIAVVAASQTC